MLGEYEDCDTPKRELSVKERYVRHTNIDNVSSLYDIYEFQEQIGQGSFGIVVAVVEKNTSKNYAIKIVNKFSVGSRRIMEIRREIKILRLVQHPHIIYLAEVFESIKKIYMVFERCKESLYNNFIEKKPFRENLCRKIIKQLSEAVLYLHKRDVVHRDIKLENILLAYNPDDPTDEYFIKLSDFGLSIVKTGSGIEGMMKDRCGTVIYMAPEILSEHTYSELCDIWSIGIILYTLLYANFPFFSSRESDLIKLICNSQPDYGRKQVSTDAEDLLKRLLKKVPAERCTALEILRHPWLLEHEISTRKNDDTIIEYMKKWRKDFELPGEESDWVTSQNSEITILAKMDQDPLLSCDESRSVSRYTTPSAANVN